MSESLICTRALSRMSHHALAETMGAGPAARHIGRSDALRTIRRANAEGKMADESRLIAKLAISRKESREVVLAAGGDQIEKGRTKKLRGVKGGRRTQSNDRRCHQPRNRRLPAVEPTLGPKPSTKPQPLALFRTACSMLSLTSSSGRFPSRIATTRRRR